MFTQKALFSLIGMGLLIGSVGSTAKAQEADKAKIKFAGDIRFREEMETSGTQEARQRTRYRVRFGAKAPVSDTVDAVVRMSTGHSITSGNQDMGATNAADESTATGVAVNPNARRAFELDLGYINWKPSDSLNLMLGKRNQNLYKVTNLVFHPEFAPEGLGISYTGNAGSMKFFVNLGADWYRENATSADEFINTAQIGTSFSSDALEATVALGRYEFSGVKGVGTQVGSEFEIYQVNGEIGFNVAGLPLTVFGEYGQNSRASGAANANKTESAAGLSVGKLKDIGSWQVSGMYADNGNEAVHQNVDDNTFAAGVYGTEFLGTYQMTTNAAVTLLYDHYGQKRGSDVLNDMYRLELFYKF